MRKLATILCLGLASGAHAAGDYELYLLVCDRVACQRTAPVGADGPRADYRAPGVNLRLETLAAHAHSADVKLTVDIVPERRGAGADAAGRISVQVEPRTLRHVQYSAIASFSSADKTYQVWGRLAGTPAAARKLALAGD